MMSVSTKINQLISLREKIAKDLGFYVNFDLANSSWSYSKKAGQIKKVQNGLYSVKTGDRGVYILHNNEGEGFSSAPVMSSFTVENIQSVNINIEGNQKGLQDTSIYIFFYGKEGVLKRETIRLNEAKELTIPSGCEKARIVLFVKGTGTLQIDNVFITGIPLEIKSARYNDANIYALSDKEWVYDTKKITIHGEHKDQANITKINTSGQGAFLFRKLSLKQEKKEIKSLIIKVAQPKNNKLTGYVNLLVHNEQEGIQTIRISLGETKAVSLRNNDILEETLSFFVKDTGALPTKCIEIEIADAVKQGVNSAIDSEVFTLSPNSLLKLVGYETPQSLKELKIACIFDEFTMNCYKNEVDLITFRQDNWKEVFSIKRPHLLFVESAWKGNGGAWQYKIAKYNNQDKSELRELINWCRENKIPTIFWNKEDPIHFEKFIETASMFDHIFTTDANVIPRYKEVVKHENVYALPFSIQPNLHNPIQLINERQEGAVFAGSYYGNRHEARRKDMDDLFEVGMKHGFTIYDRNYHNENPDFRFPIQYQSAVKPSLPYSQIDQAYKGYKFMFNVNSVKESPTMFSRRVFEGLACGTPIVSTYSVGIDEIFGSELIIMDEELEKLEETYVSVIQNPTEYNKRVLQGIRVVYEKHTYEERLWFILDKIGIDVKERDNHSVGVIAFVQTDKEAEKVYNEFQRQNYQQKKLILVTDVNIKVYADVVTIKKDAVESFIEEESSLQYYALFSPNNFYGANYIRDLAIAAQYSKAEVNGKATYYNGNVKSMVGKDEQTYTYVHDLEPAASLISREVILNLEHEKRMELLEEKQSMDFLFKIGVRLFSADKYNFVKNVSDSVLGNIQEVEL